MERHPWDDALRLTNGGRAGFEAATASYDHLPAPRMDQDSAQQAPQRVMNVYEPNYVPPEQAPGWFQGYADPRVNAPAAGYGHYINEIAPKLANMTLHVAQAPTFPNPHATPFTPGFSSAPGASFAQPAFGNQVPSNHLLPFSNGLAFGPQQTSAPQPPYGPQVPFGFQLPFGPQHPYGYQHSFGPQLAHPPGFAPFAAQARPPPPPAHAGMGFDPDRFAESAQPPFNPNRPPPPAELLTVGHQSVNRRINNPNRDYGSVLRGRPPVNTQPPLHVDISMWEILTFCPAWLQIPDVVMRAVRNGWKRVDLAKVQLEATNDLNQGELHKAGTRIQQQISQGGKMHTGLLPRDYNVNFEAIRREIEENPSLQNDLTADEWELRDDYEERLMKGQDKKKKTKKLRFGHAKLVDLYGPVPHANWPTGTDRMLLTQCLEFARANPALDLDTSHFDWIIQTQGLQAPQLPVYAAGQNHDTVALVAAQQIRNPTH